MVVSEKRNKLFSVSSCENFIQVKDTANLIEFIEFSRKMGIQLLGIENFTIQMIEQFIKDELNASQDKIKSISSIFPQIQECPTIADKVKRAKQVIRNSPKSIFLFSRKTLRGESISNLKNELNKYRKKFEVISVFSDSIEVSKWASHDRRVDYLTIDISKKETIDEGLISLAKQHNMIFELCLYPLFSSNNAKQLSSIIRSAKKITSNLIIKQNKFILTIKPRTPYHFRTSVQLRYLGELIGIPFNKTKNAVFNEQLKILLSNLTKLSENYVFNGIEIIGEAND